MIHVRDLKDGDAVDLEEILSVIDHDPCDYPSAEYELARVTEDAYDETGYIWAVHTDAGSFGLPGEMVLWKAVREKDL